MRIKTTCNFPKFYICKYGAFYEGERLAQYCWSGGDNYYYSTDVIIEKFVVHYHNYQPYLCFKFHEVGKARSFTLSVDQLGICYRKYKN